MNRFTKHHELVHKWELEKALDTWGVPDRPITPRNAKKSRIFSLRFEYRFHWALQAPATNWYGLHPELKRLGPSEAQAYWPDMPEVEGEMDAPRAFAQLSA